MNTFLKTRYRVILGQKDDGDHWVGGEVNDPGATCPNCKLPLVLHWDINCRDSRFPRNKFGQLKRLPLLYCWSCVDDLAYQLSESGRVKVISRKMAEFRGPSFQYEPYPASFEKRPLALDSNVPDEAKVILFKWSQAKDSVSFGMRLSAKWQRTLAEYFGHPVNLPFTLIHHQLGGPEPRGGGYEEGATCPNRMCPSRLSDGKGRPMSFLAEILNDPWGGLPMVERATAETRPDWNFLVSVQFLICYKCWTVHAYNRCD